MRLTREWLKERGACVAGRRWFGRHYPRGVDRRNARSFAEVLVAHNASWAEWLVGFFPPLWEEYARQRASLWVEYERQVALLWAEYERQRASLDAEYERQVAPLWAEYERQEAPLLIDHVVRAVAALAVEGRAEG